MLSGDKKISSVVVAGLVASLVIVAGCGSEHQEGSAGGGVNALMLSDFTIDKEGIAMYADNNKLDPGNDRYVRALRSYVERNALAYVISNEVSQIMPGVMHEMLDKRNTALIKEYLDAYVESAVDDVVVKEYYTAHPEYYTKKKVKLAHILIADNGLAQDVQATKREAAVALVEEIRKGSEFSSVASKYSDDKETKNNGGDIGWVSEGDGQYGILLEAALSSRGGDVLEPVQTSQGFHIVKLLEDVVGEEVPFDSVKDKISYQLKYDARTKEMARLRDLASVKIKEDVASLDIE